MLHILIRECSEYTSEPLNLGVFTTAENAYIAKKNYITHYQSHLDPLSEQAYRDVNLENDVNVWTFPTDEPFDHLAFLILGTCEAMGQISQGIDHIKPDFTSACEIARQLHQENHAKCQINSDGKHCCTGFIDSLLIDVIEIDQLRFKNRSSYFDAKCCHRSFHQR
jgi:hypothetical protein